MANNEKKIKSELYELMGDMAELQRRLNESDDEDFQQILEDTIEANEDTVSDNIEGLIAIQRDYMANAKKMKEEKDFFAKRQSQYQSKADTVQAYIENILKQLNVDHKNKKKIETKFGKVGFQKNPPSILVTDTSKIPMEYEKVLEPQYDTVQLLKDLKEKLEYEEIETTAKGKEKKIKKQKDELDLTEEFGVKIINDSAHFRIR